MNPQFPGAVLALLREQFAKGQMSGEGDKRHRYGKLRIRPEDGDGGSGNDGGVRDGSRYDHYAHDNNVGGDGSSTHSQPDDSLDRSGEKPNDRLVRLRKSKRIEEREASGKPPYRSQPPKKREPPPPAKRPSGVALLRSTQRRLQAEAAAAASKPAQLRRDRNEEDDSSTEEEQGDEREEEGDDEYIENAEEEEEEEGEDDDDNTEPETHPPPRNSRSDPGPSRSRPRKQESVEHRDRPRRREVTHERQTPSMNNTTPPGQQAQKKASNSFAEFFKTWYSFTFLGLAAVTLIARITGNKMYDLFPQGSWYIQIFVLFTVSWIISVAAKTLFEVGRTLFALLMIPVRIFRGTIVYLAMAVAQPIRWLRGIDDPLEGDQTKTPKRANNNSRAQAHANFHSKTAR